MENVDLWPVHIFADALAHGGVRHAVISPGSRNTPLTLSFVEQQDIKVFTHLDERSAGFFALGLARATNTPVILACTSGTAAANYYPALIEAFEARVPLIVVTADRPHMLRDVGANQAIRQPNMYANHVKWSVELPVPDGQTSTARHAVSVAARAAAIAQTVPQGPVHINYPFVEPLMLPPKGALNTEQAVPMVNLHMSSHKAVGLEGMAMLDDALAAAERPLIVVGPQQDLNLARHLVAFAAAREIPLLADPLSQARFIHTDGPIIALYDLLLAEEHDTALIPDLILRFGAEPTSKSLSMFMRRAHLSGSRVVICDETPMYRDAVYVATDVVICDVLPWLQQGLEGPEGQSKWSSFTALWKTRERLVERCMDEFLSEHWFEGTLLTDLVDGLPEDAQLFIGNSRPVRDLDALCKTRRNIVTFGNRGASGIDGIVSTAFGVACANPHRKTVLCLGDVSFYHDLNGLLAASRFDIPLTIVLVNNDGGGIFQHLSQASRLETLPYFTTPHGLQFGQMVSAYGGVFRQVADRASFRDELTTAVQANKLTVIEAQFANDESAGCFKELRQMIAKAVEAQDK